MIYRLTGLQLYGFTGIQNDKSTVLQIIKINESIHVKMSVRNDKSGNQYIHQLIN
jgi:hypothetical protein